MNILVIGSGGREHALCWKIRQSPLVKKLYCAPGNGGIASAAECVSLDSHQAIAQFCQANHIGLVVIGPEQPLVQGLADVLAAAGIKVFGPSAKAAQLEGSKGFTKDLCRKYNIPTAAYGRFGDAASAEKYIRAQGAPIVVKADGLAAGKGVIVAMHMEEALEAVHEIFGGKFGAAGTSVVVEEFLQGEEASFFALCDGATAIEFCAAQDHKRVGEGDTGPNTGGMGTYSPTVVMSDALRRETMEKIILPTIAAMKKEGMPYSGVLFAGLMITKDGVKLIEYNARFGDPETQAMLARMTSDLVPALLACALPAPSLRLRGEDQGGGHSVVDIQSLSDIKLEFDARAALCVVMAAKGYPGDYEKNTLIRGLDKAAALKDVVVFHAGTTLKDGQILATGGRVLGVTALGHTIAAAQALAYKAVDAIDWPQGFCRHDIGWRAVKAL